MATRNSYADYLKTIPSGAVGANGLLGGPSTGVNYQAEGMTPEQYYQFMTQQVSDPMARDGSDGGYRDRGPADASWVGGAQKTGASAEFWTSLAALMSMGALSGAGAAAGTGMSAGSADAALAAFDASQLAGAPSMVGAGTGGLGLGGEIAFTGIGEFPTAIGTETGFGGGFGTAGAGAGIEGYGGVTGALEAGGSAAGGGSLIDSAGSWLKENPTLAKLGGAAIGALSSKDTQSTSTNSKDPWLPAQKYLLDNLETNANAQEHYRQNPFSDLQKQQYQGLFDSLANSNANAPGLLANASNFGKSSRGKMPAMTGLLSGTQAAPVDWTQYQNIGRK